MRDISIRKKSRRIVALALGLMMVVAYTPALAFADGTQSVAELKAAMEEAERQMNAAQEAVDEADKAIAGLEQVLQGKEAAFSEAEAALADAQSAETAAESARDAAFANTKTEAEEAYNAAVEAYNAAVQAYNEAALDLEAKTTALENAEAAKSTIEGEIATLNEEKTEAQELVNSLPAQIDTATQAKNAAVTQWEQDKQNAADAVATAQAAYDEAGYTFINNKIDGLGSNYYTLPEMIEVCKGYTDKNLGIPCTFNGKSITTIADVANDALFLEIVKSNCKKENLLLAMDMIDESNVLRQAENKSVLGVSYQLMGAAIMSNSYSLYSFSHDLINANGKDANGYANTDSFWAIGPATWGNENLHASTDKITSAAAPFNGWYHNEKEALQRAVDSGNWPGLSMDQSTRYIWTNYPNLSYETYQAGYGQVGHYLTLKNEEYTTTGMAVTYNSGTVPTKWRGRATQSFNDDTENSISVEQCRSEINAAFADTEAALNTALENQQALEAKPETVINAEATLQQKQQAYADAQQTLANAEAAITAKEAELQTAEANVTKKEGELQTAESNKTAKETAMNNAQTAKEEALAVHNKAQAIDPDNPDTYKDFEDLKNLVAAYAQAQATTAIKQQAVANAEAERNTAKAEYDEAKQNCDYDAKVDDYNIARDAYEAAKKAYNEAVASQEAAHDISNATITVANVTYSGAAKTPAPTVVLNGVTLVKDTDYTVGYTNNTNAGKATVTVTGTGDYEGSVSKTFTINKAANTLVAKGKTYTVKFKALKKKNQIVTVKKAFNVSKNKGKVTYKKSSGNKKIVVSTAGKVTVKKGLKKGTYKIKVKVTAAGDKNYKSITKNVTTTIKVK